jgi:putative aldouronate transport system substrate-binding protein
MKKKLNKVLPVVLVTVMTAMLLAGCGGKSTNSSDASPTGTSSAPGSSDASADNAKDVKDMVTVNFVAPGVYDTTDAPLVQDAMNKILAEKYGIQCNILFVNMGSWTEQTNLLLTDNEVDVLPFYTLPLTSYVNNGQALPLDNYVANASDKFKSLWTEDQMKGCQVKGVQYSIPNLRNFGNDMCLIASTEKLEQLGVKAEDIKSLADVDTLLYKAKEAFTDLQYILVPQSGSTMNVGWSWDGLGDQNWVGVLGNCGQDATVQNVFDTKDFQEFCSYTHKWYNDGLIMGDALSNQESAISLISAGSAFASFMNASNAEFPGYSKCIIVPNWTDSTNISALSYGINSLSSHPDEAWTLLEALYTDDDLATLLINGIQDVHYVLNEDGSCSYPEGVTITTSTYGNATAYWAFPYAGNIPPITDLGRGAKFYDELVQFNTDSRVSAAAGFVFDNSAVVDEYTACLNIIKNYYNGLMCGVLDPETVIPQADAELKAAGMDKVIAEKQRQLDELLVTK